MPILTYTTLETEIWFRFWQQN